MYNRNLLSDFDHPEQDDLHNEENNGPITHVRTTITTIRITCTEIFRSKHSSLDTDKRKKQYRPSYRPVQSKIFSLNDPRINNPGCRKNFRMN